MHAKKPFRWERCLWLVAALGALTGCTQKMNVEPKYEAFAASSLFADGASARMPVEGTVARGALGEEAALKSGRRDGQWIDGYPFEITAERMEHGRERYDIFCSPCHGYLGDGNGSIVQRGLRGPVSFHQPRFRAYPTGYFVEVITNGRGAMYPYGARIPVGDRWEIVAYVRALQASQHALLDSMPAAEQQRLTASEAP